MIHLLSALVLFFPLELTEFDSALCEGGEVAHPPCCPALGGLCSCHLLHDVTDYQCYNQHLSGKILWRTSVYWHNAWDPTAGTAVLGGCFCGAQQALATSASLPLFYTVLPWWHRSRQTCLKACMKRSCDEQELSRNFFLNLSSHPVFSEVGLFSIS